MRKTFTTTTSAILLAILFTHPSPTLCDDDSCVTLSATMTGNSMMSYYLFSGHLFTYTSRFAARGGGGAENGGQVKSIYDWIGMEDKNVDITAGYMDPESDNTMKVFSNDKVYTVDMNTETVLHQSPISDMFNEEEDKEILQAAGIQAAAVVHDKTSNGFFYYFFSGCNVLKTDFNGNREVIDLDAARVPCNVDSAMTFTGKSRHHFLLTVGGRAYGLMLRGPRAVGYDMFCAKRKFKHSAFDLCDC